MKKVSKPAYNKKSKKPQKAKNGKQSKAKGY
jgi:hypothetical protein